MATKLFYFFRLFSTFDGGFRLLKSFGGSSGGRESARFSNWYGSDGGSEQIKVLNVHYCTKKLLL